MKKILLALSLLFSASSMVCTAQRKLVDIDFIKGGAVNCGEFEAEITPYSTSASYLTSLYDPIKQKYMGVTSKDTRGFYYMLYNATDALGKAFSTAATWELLFRLDSQQGMTWSNSTDSGTGTTKIFSSQESGGWTLTNYSNTGLRFQYVNISSTNTADPQYLIETGKFYHVVVSVDNVNKKMNMYINGEHLVVDQAIDASEYKQPNIGSTKRTTNMWWCIGGDCQATNTPNRVSNSAQATYITTRIYDAAMTEEQALKLYNNDVKYYTEPRVKNPDQIILDAVFNADGASDKSRLSASTEYLTHIGKVETQYNIDQKRYEGNFTQISGNFFRRDFWYDPLITSQLSDSYSYEVYAKASTKNPSAIISPLSAQQSGGMGFEINGNGDIRFNANTYGYQSANSSCGSGQSTTSTGANTLTTDYTHYVVSFDRKTGRSSIYINGVEKAYKDAVTELDNVNFCYGPYQWFCVGGDTRSSDLKCDYPFTGQISIARVWDKGLTASDVKELYNQTQQNSRTITIGESGYATVCLPFNAQIPAGLTAYVISSQTESEVVLSKLATTGSIIAYGIPIIMQGTPGNYTIVAADIPNSSIITPNANNMFGTFIDRSFKAGEAYILTPEGTFSNAAGTVKAGEAFIYGITGNAVKTIKISGSNASSTISKTLETNVNGRVTCSGEGVEGVVVSDGYTVVTTDADGYYAFYSEKKNGYVFISIPPGYEIYENYNTTAAEKIFVPFWQAMTYSKAKAETHNFKLKVKNNDSHIMVIGTDTHVSTASSQNQFFNLFINALKKEATDAGSTPIYSTLLGDLTCNYHWYTQNYFPETFRASLVSDNYPIKLFPIMGNHDHDSAIDDGYNSSWNSTWRYRQYLGPHYYSYNLGKVHYVVLDDTYFLNTHTPGASYSKGVTGDQDYYNHIEEYQLEWLKKDLQYVDKETPVIIGLHIPVHRLNTSTFVTTNGLTNGGSNSSILLDEIVKDYKKVYILSGHTHYNYHAHPADYPNIHENNLAAVCAIWWTQYSVNGRHNCSDGSPGGYTVYSINGTDVQWQFRSLEDNNNSQFHVVDMNPVKKQYKEDANIKALSDYCVNNPNFTATRMDYSTIEDNCVLLNVYNYDTDWKIEVKENGKSLTPVRGGYEDPVHYMCYDYPWYVKNKSISRDSRTGISAHIFKIKCATADADLEVKVTDPFGNIYTETVKRPMVWDDKIMGHNTTILTGINEQVKASSRATIYCRQNTICIDGKTNGTAQIISLDGKSKITNISAGHNEIPVQKAGIYVVRANGQTTKLYVR